MEVLDQQLKLSYAYPNHQAQLARQTLPVRAELPKLAQHRHQRSQSLKLYRRVAQ